MNYDIISKVIFALGFVLIILGSGVYLLQKWRRPTPANQKRLKVLEVFPLDQKRYLYVIQDGPDEHLILAGASSEILIRTRNVASGVPQGIPSSQPTLTKEFREKEPTLQWGSEG